MNYNGHRMEIEKIKSRVLAAFVRANPGIVGCVRFKYRKLELSLVGKWSREEQEWSEGMSPEKVKGSPRQLFLSERHATLLVVGGGGGGGVGGGGEGDKRCVTGQKRLGGRLVRKRLPSLSYSQAFPRSNLPLTDQSS